ncbi:MAG TPA: DUF3775 domain-containing protein [Gemmataceae bacterium]|nr:DUF3775 domain-containing protein [Gemmataceae bacterium]
MNLSEAADRVIDLAGKVREYYATELPKRHPNYPVVGVGEESAPSPPEEKELRDFLLTLSQEMLYQLILIMYLGRGDYGTDDLAGYYEALKGTFGDLEHTASQMMDKAPLADYLLDGLEELRKHKINVDKMPLKKIKVRKR